MSTVEVTIELPAPPDRVWDVVMDPRRLGDWVTIHRAMLSYDKGPPAAGMRMRQRVHLRGVSVDIRWLLVECDPPRRAVWEGKGPARSRARTEYLLRPARGGHTEFQYRNEFRVPLGPIGAVVSAALVGGMAEHEARHTLERLRDLLGESEK